MEIGTHLKTARIESKLTQEQAAEALGVSRQTMSNWETGRTIPDIISAVRMSELYSISLDQLLKEETSMNQSYLSFLAESTDQVKSDRKKSLLILCFAVFIIWSLFTAVFFLVRDTDIAANYCLFVNFTVLPVLFFSASFIISLNNYFSKWKWLAAPVYALMYSFSGNVNTVAVEGMLFRSVTWPDFKKAPGALIISLAGLAVGALVRKNRASRNTDKD